jgi:hypothetical protein
MFLRLLGSHIKITAEYKRIAGIVINDKSGKGPKLQGRVTRIHTVTFTYHAFIYTHRAGLVKAELTFSLISTKLDVLPLVNRTRGHYCIYAEQDRHKRG